MISFAHRVRAALVVAAVAAMSMAGMAQGAYADSSGVVMGKVPFTDPGANGLLTFCNRQGQPMTSGSLYTRPFAWKTVSSVEAPAGYRNSHARASLYAFQPIQYIEPGAWVGADLVDASSYSNPQHPVDQATNDDLPLLGFANSYPAHWAGLLQLRLLINGTNEPSSTARYATAVIKITGSNWTLVQGGGTPCNAGTGVNNALKTLGAKALGKPVAAVPVGQATPSAAAVARASSATSQGGGVTTAPGGNGTTTRNAADTESTTSSGGLSSGAKAGIGLGVVAVLALLGAAFVGWRRRSSPGL